MVFHQIIAIRNGEAPRPAGYEGVYWDLVAAGEPSGDWMFDGMQQVVIVMWQILVPLSLVVACVAGVRRERRTLRDQQVHRPRIVSTAGAPESRSCSCS